jgi:predicted N-acetyltransferase YhbS
VADPGSHLRPTISVLTDSCKVEDFDCGEPARNAWLCTRAFANQRNDDTRSYVAMECSRVIGFYALTVGSIIRSSVPTSARKNAPDPIGCVLLAQLAVDLPYQGRGLSRHLVMHAMGQAIKISDLAGGRLFAVHPARPEFESYYSKFGFIAAQTIPPVMVMTMQKVRATLAAVAASRPA